MSEPAIHTEAKGNPAWRRQIANGEIVAAKADATRAYYIGGWAE